MLAVVLSFDKRYIIPALVSIKSLLKHVSDKSKIEFFCLHKGLNSTLRRLVEEVVHFYGSTITFIDMTNSMKGLTYINNKSEELFYPLFIPKYFSSYQYVLSLDADILVRDDILKLVTEIPENKKIGAVRCMFRNCEKFGDFGDFSSYAKNCVGIKDINRYFNGGFVIFNMKNISKEDAENCISLLSKRWKSNEEAILNRVYQNDSYLFSMRWNYQMELYNVESGYYIEEIRMDIENSKNNIAICHFIGHSKPWSRSFSLSKDNKYILEYESAIKNVMEDIRKFSPFVLCGPSWNIIGSVL